ncbi:MAG: hypothetical protein AAFU79_10680, partial [Myxococcota bacterium]
FAFRERLPMLELVFRRSLQKYGILRRVYYDNGQVFRSHHIPPSALTEADQPCSSEVLHRSRWILFGR